MAFTCNREVSFAVPTRVVGCWGTPAHTSAGTIYMAGGASDNPLSLALGTRCDLPSVRISPVHWAAPAEELEGQWEGFGGRELWRSIPIVPPEGLEGWAGFANCSDRSFIWDKIRSTWFYWSILPNFLEWNDNHVTQIFPEHRKKGALSLPPPKVSENLNYLIIIQYYKTMSLNMYLS